MPKLSEQEKSDIRESIDFRVKSCRDLFKDDDGALIHYLSQYVIDLIEYDAFLSPKSDDESS